MGYVVGKEENMICGGKGGVQDKGYVVEWIEDGQWWDICNMGNVMGHMVEWMVVIRSEKCGVWDMQWNGWQFGSGWKCGE